MAYPLCYFWRFLESMILKKKTMNQMYKILNNMQIKIFK